MLDIDFITKATENFFIWTCNHRSFEDSTVFDTENKLSSFGKCIFYFKYACINSTHVHWQTKLFYSLSDQLILFLK